MQNLVIKKPAGWGPIHIILLVAALLRLPYVFTSSYTHDELSALQHLDQAGLKGLWQYVLHDYHPPLVQFFLFAYTKILGQAEWIVKFPFALCGLWAIWLVYRTGKRFFNEPAALYAAAFMAVAQVFVFHSNVARPYAPGLLFCILFMQVWLKLILEEDRSTKTKILYIIYALLAAGTHYFAGITVGLAGLLGLLMVKRSSFFSYVLVNALVMLALLPVLYVMKVQLSHGGLGGWLGAPEENYVWKFIFYHFHYSLSFLITTVFFLVAGIVFLFRQKLSKKYRPHLVMVFVYLSIFLTAYFYSLYVSPVMQFSILYFALPFLLLPLFSVMQGIPGRRNWLIGCFLFMGAGLYSLFVTRDHHQLVNDYPYHSFARFCAPYLQDKNVLIITSDRPEFLARYMDTSGVVSTYGKENPQHRVLEAIQKQKPTMVISGNNDFIPYSLLRSYYPFVLQRKEGFLNNFFVLSQVPVPASLERRETDPWKIPASRQEIKLDSATQFFNLLDTTLDALQLHNNTQWWFRARVQSAEVQPAILVMEFHQDNQLKFWYGLELFVRADTSAWNNCYGTYDPQAEIKKLDRKKARIKMYLWNNRLVKSKFRDIQIGFMEPNHRYYGLTEDIYP